MWGAGCPRGLAPSSAFSGGPHSVQVQPLLPLNLALLILRPAGDLRAPTLSSDLFHPYKGTFLPPFQPPPSARGGPSSEFPWEKGVNFKLYNTMEGPAWVLRTVSSAEKGGLFHQSQGGTCLQSGTEGGVLPPATASGGRRGRATLITLGLS